MTEVRTPIELARLGATCDLYQLHSVEEARALAIQMVSQAGRSLDLLTTDLEPVLYDQQGFLEAFKQLALKSKVARIRILLQDNSLVRNQGHRLIELVQRLPSTVELRKPNRVSREFQENFLLVDDCGYLHRRLIGRYQLSACCNDRLQVSQFESLFTEIWENGEADRELARLYL